MKQQHPILSFLILAATATAATGLLGGCAAHRAAAVPQAVAADPQGAELTPDAQGRVDVDIAFRIPADYLAQRARLVITPQVLAGDSVCQEGTPLVVDAPIYSKKLDRRERLEGYQDPHAARRTRRDNPGEAFSLPYAETLSLPAGIDTARIVAVVSTDGCGECTGLDTLALATIVRPALYIRWMEPRFTVRPKVADGQGEARLQFAINRHDIDPALGNNRAELEAMAQALRPVLTDTLATVRSFSIRGMASADGSLPFNTRLARQRAEAAKQYIVQALGLAPEQAEAIQTGSRPEGWQPVLDAMRRDQHPDADQVAGILSRYADSDDDVQERHIRRLDCWGDIKDRYLQKDRKVEYAYSYTLRSFTTDAEVLEMYAKRPDAFNQEELLRAATLMPTDAEKMEVYRTLLARFPQNATALNNLAWLLLRDGQEAEARQLLARRPDLYPDIERKQLKTTKEEQAL